jgi:putative acetyltransferase
MTGRLVYPDVWWRLDLVGLRDPLLGQLENG